ncbi:MAG: hypothetical protein AAFR66_03895 [Bacteroidota bacterium]
MKHYYLCLFLALGLLSACQKDSPVIPEESFDIKITGKVYHALSHEGYAGMNIQAAPPSYSKWSQPVNTMTDKEGNFTIRLKVISDTLKAEDLSQQQLLALVNPIYQGMSVRMIQNECGVTNIDKHFPLTRFQDAIPSYPLEINLDYPVLRASDFVLNLKTGNVTNPVTAQVHLRELSQNQGFASWSPLELELRGEERLSFCAPTDREVEVVVSFFEYVDDPFRVLADKIVVDTFRIADDQVNAWSVSYK